MLSLMPELNRSIVLSDERIHLPAAFNLRLTEGECAFAPYWGKLKRSTKFYSQLFSIFSIASSIQHKTAQNLLFPESTSKVM